jgi:hypothetical protein
MVERILEIFNKAHVYLTCIVASVRATTVTSNEHEQEQHQRNLYLYNNIRNLVISIAAFVSAPTAPSRDGA